MISLSAYDLVIINSSGGKDSLCAIWEVCRIAAEQSYSLSKIVISHQDLGRSEWPGTKELVQKQADLFGLAAHYSKRRNSTGVEETLLEYVERRGKWPSNKQRYCTSDFKRGPGARVLTKLSKQLEGSSQWISSGLSILYVFGFRAQESPFRSKREVFSWNKRLSNSKRVVTEWLPIHDWSLEKVWQVIRENNLPYHYAYDLGMPRLSCCFCIFSPFDALVLAGKANPELLDKYVEVEQRIGHTFKANQSLASVRQAIAEGYEPGKISDWKM